MRKSIDEQICDLYKKKHGAFKIAKHFGVDVGVVWKALECANLVRKSKIMKIGELVACRRFGGYPHRLARVVRPSRAGPHYYIVCGMNNITHWGEWSGALDDPKTVVCRECKCETEVLMAFGCQCEEGKKIWPVKNGDRIWNDYNDEDAAKVEAVKLQRFKEDLEANALRPMEFKL